MVLFIIRIIIMMIIIINNNNNSCVDKQGYIKTNVFKLKKIVKIS